MLQEFFSKTRSGARFNLYLFSVLFLILIQPGDVIAKMSDILMKTEAPIQILDVSKSSLDLGPGESDHMVLTLINLSEYEKSVQLEQKIDSDVIRLDYDSDFKIPGSSILRVPVDFTAPAEANDLLIYGLLQVSSNFNQPVDLFVSQPFKIKLNSVSPVPEIKSSSSHFVSLSVLLLLVMALALAYFQKRHKYVPTLLILSLGTYGTISLINDPLMYSSANLKADTLSPEPEIVEEIMNEEVSGLEYVIANYEYESEEGESYIELYGQAANSTEKVDFVYDQGLDFSNIHESTELHPDGSEDVDIQEASADTDLISTGSATDNVDLSVNDEADSTTPDEEFGLQVPLIRGYHSDYKGLEIRALAILAPQNLNRDLVRKYVRIALSMTDNGDMRRNSLRLCEIFKKEEFDEMDKIDFQNILLSVLSDRNVDFEKIQEYANLVFDDTEGVIHEQGRLLCEDFEKAHETAMKDVTITEYKTENSPATPDAEETVSISSVEVPATKDTDQLQATATKATETIRAKSENTIVKKVSNTDEGSIRIFSIYDLPNNPDLSEEKSPVPKSANDEPEVVAQVESTIVSLDLTMSDLIEIIIPNRIELPPLARQGNAYNTRNSMGDFQIRTFKEATDWNGFFTFEVIKLQDGEELTDMWLEINNKKIAPDKTKSKSKNYLNYQVSSELFDTNSGGVFEFNPYIWIRVPAKAAPGEYNSNISFTLVQ